jgi:hypothetical protein
MESISGLWHPPLSLRSSDNTGFAASFHFAQTAFGAFAKPGNVICNHTLYVNIMKMIEMMEVKP